MRKQDVRWTVRCDVRLAEEKRRGTAGGGWMPFVRLSSALDFRTDQSERRKGDTCDWGERGAHDAAMEERTEGSSGTDRSRPLEGGHWRQGFSWGQGRGTCRFLRRRSSPLRRPFFSRKDNDPHGPWTDPPRVPPGTFWAARLRPRFERVAENRSGSWRTRPYSHRTVRNEGGSLRSHPCSAATLSTARS